MPRGGHFAAFEEPELFAADVIQFVAKVEKRLLEKQLKNVRKPLAEGDV